MEKLNDLWNLPMLWNIIIPTVAIFGFVIFLVWDATRLPVEKSILHKLRIKRRADKAAHHHPRHTSWKMES